MSVATARRMALAAQGFGPRPSGPPTARHLRRVVDRVVVLQLDPISVVCRSHYVPMYSRVGPYSMDRLDRMAWDPKGRELFEYWGHQASLLPLGLHPLLRWRMDAARAWDWATWEWPGSGSGWREQLGPLMAAPWEVLTGMMRIGKERPDLVNEVLAVVAERGPVSAGEANPEGTRERRPRKGGMWNWGDVKIVLEWLFFTGEITTAFRRGFERIYDLTERVLPADVLALPTPDPAEAQRELIRIAARAQGVATGRQLREYFGIRGEEGNLRIAELVEAGALVPVRVEGILQLLYGCPGAATPADVEARGFLSPFDSLIWDRDRTLKLFGFHYRISIYTPAAKRVHGYYVLPFLLGDGLVARADLRADRAANALVVEGAFAEPGVEAEEVARAMAWEARSMADWLGLDRVVIGGNGDLIPHLTRQSGAGGPAPD